ncbi:MAG: Mrp/NBP35 family ATP-binding protein [bacterium]|nr:Mrp/NBP35 family ATP-binding protein [bacterium]
MAFPRTIPEGSTTLPGVANVVAVSSAKGGVGKSTVAVNLALSFARDGARVGLLDADIYGPSLPVLTGIREQPEIRDGDRIQPLRAHGLALMSMGFLAGQDAPVVWRGPLLAQAVQQFLQQVDWGVLDILILDLPPGTGDIPLTLSQAVALSGAVVVTTPQDVALQDVERGMAMFDKVDVDIIGLVENMSYYLCPHCDKRHEIFGHGGGRRMAARLGVDFLGEIPLDATVREGGDRGTPTMLAEPDSARGQAFSAIAAGILAALAG